MNFAAALGAISLHRSQSRYGEHVASNPHTISQRAVQLFLYEFQPGGDQVDEDRGRWSQICGADIRMMEGHLVLARGNRSKGRQTPLVVYSVELSSREGH